MEKYLFITKNKNGSVTIKDSVTDTKTTYYFLSERGAIKQHRENTGTARQRFARIYL